MPEDSKDWRKAQSSREAELEAKVAELEASTAALNAENARLRAELAALRKRLTPKSAGSGTMSTRLSDALRE